MSPWGREQRAWDPIWGVKLRFRVRVCVSGHTTHEQEGLLLFLEDVLWPPCPTRPSPLHDCDRKRVGCSGWLVAHPGVGQALCRVLGLLGGCPLIVGEMTSPSSSRSCSLVQENPELAMDSLVYISQHISPAERAQVIHLLSTVDSPAST